MYVKLFVRCFNVTVVPFKNQVTNVLTEVILYYKSDHICSDLFKYIKKTCVAKNCSQQLVDMSNISFVMKDSLQSI